MATAGVLLSKGVAEAGPRVERSEMKQGVVWQSIGKAVHTQGGAHKGHHTQKVVYGHRKSLVIIGGCGG